MAELDLSPYYGLYYHPSLWEDNSPAILAYVEPAEGIEEKTNVDDVVNQIINHIQNTPDQPLEIKIDKNLFQPIIDKLITHRLTPLAIRMGRRDRFGGKRKTRTRHVRSKKNRKSRR